MRHILHLHPDIIKLDRKPHRRHRAGPRPTPLGAAMVEFARQIQTQLVAEVIASEAELAAVTGLGMYSAPQGRDMQTNRTIRCERWAEAGTDAPEAIFTTCAPSPRLVTARNQLS